MKRMKRLAVLALAVCLLATMLPAIPSVTAVSEEAVLNSIEIISLCRTEYWLGEQLQTEGLRLAAHYSDGSTQEITQGFTLSGYNNQVAGRQTITVTYMGATDTFTVTVIRSEITNIAIGYLPVKTQYWIGESLDTTGLTLLATYSDGNTKEIIDGFTVSGYNSAIAGEQTLTVSYMGKTATFAVTVKQLEVNRISILRLPKKTEYWEGEPLETAGLTLVVSYCNGDTAERTEGFTVSGFDSSVVGKQTLTVSYQGATAVYTVTVKKLEAIGIEIVTLPQKTEYYTGEPLDTTGLTLLVTYLGGATAQITEGFTVTGYNSALAGWQTVTVIYGEVATEFSVYVEERYLIDIVISTPPEKTEYWIGEPLDTTGLVLTLTYSDGSIKQVTEGYTVSGFSSTSAGTKVVTVEYEGVFAVLNVEVKAPTTSTITGIEIYTLPAKTEYFVGEKKDFSGLSVYVLYSDGSKEVVTSGWADSGFNSSSAGTKTITLRYKLRYTAKFTVTIKTVELTGIQITTMPDKTQYWIGEELDTTGLTVSETWSDGKTVPITEYTLTGFDSTTAGEKTITVTYQGNTATFPITVIQCEHIQAVGNVCTQCGKTITIMLTDTEGNAIGNYATLSDAVEVAQVGQTLSLQVDAVEEDVILTPGVTLDLNGHTLTAGSVQTYGSSVILDSSAEVSGLLKITETDGNLISAKNSHLPVYDSALGGYRFFCVTVTPKAVTGNHKYWFRVDVENFAVFYELLQSGAQVRVQVKMTWDGQETDVYAVADVAFTKAWADGYQQNKDTYITVSVTEGETVENFKLIPGLTSGGVEIFGEEM